MRVVYNIGRYLHIKQPQHVTIAENCLMHQCPTASKNEILNNTIKH